MAAGQRARRGHRIRSRGAAPFRRSARFGAGQHRTDPDSRSCPSKGSTAFDRRAVPGEFRPRPGGDRIRAVARSGHVPHRSMAIRINRVTLRQLRMPLVHFFETSFGRTYTRDIVLVEVEADGISGWGEVTA